MTAGRPRLSEEERKTKIQVMVSADVEAKIKDLAGRMGLSISTMASMLLMAGVDDNELIIRFVTSRIGKAILTPLVKGKKSKAVLA